MSPRAFQTLLWATVLAVVLAIAALRFDRAPEAQRLAGGDRAAPYGARASDVAKIVVETKDYALTLQKKGETWVAADRGDYPARPGAVANLMTSLSAMRLSERKTQKPALFEEIGVEDRKAGASSTMLSFNYADSGSAGALLVGKRSNAASFDQAGATFVRRVGDNQSWLAQGSPNLPRDFSEWFTELPGVPATEVNAVTISEDGKAIFEAKKNGEGLYARADASEPAANDTNVKRVAQALVSTGFDDVRPASAMTTVKRSIRLELADGKHIAVTVGEGDGQTFVGFDGDATGAAAEVIKTTKGYVFKLPSYRLSGLTQSLADLTAEEAPSQPQMPPGFNPHQGMPGGGLPPGFPGGQLPPGFPGMPR